VQVQVQVRAAIARGNPRYRGFQSHSFSHQCIPNLTPSASIAFGRRRRRLACAVPRCAQHERERFTRRLKRQASPTHKAFQPRQRRPKPKRLARSLSVLQARSRRAERFTAGGRLKPLLGIFRLDRARYAPSDKAQILRRKGGTGRNAPEGR
jgi:hypothetical protein